MSDSARNALRAGLVGIVVSMTTYPCRAELTTEWFQCKVEMFPDPSVSPVEVLVGIEPGKMSLSLNITPPYVNKYVLVGDGKVGLVGVSTDRHYHLHEPGVTASMILIDRLTGALRWIEARADSQTNMVGKGICVDAP